MATRVTNNAIPGVADYLFQGLRRIIAPNPSPMTCTGTNTYLIGTRDIAVIDPGPPEQSHLDAILGTLSADQRISHILVTHSHVDHSPLAMTLAQITDARIYGFGPSSAGRADVMADLDHIGGGEGLDETFLPDVALKDGDVLEGSNWQLEAIHTPGHMGNHMCFAWDSKRVLFSGDHVMDWATSMVSPPDGHLTDFMASIQKLRQRNGDRTYYPGHGGPVADPVARLDELFAHRKMREAQILRTLDAPRTPEDITRAIYTDIDEALWPAAERNVLAHLIDLHIRKIVIADGEISAQVRFKKTASDGS